MARKNRRPSTHGPLKVRHSDRELFATITSRDQLAAGWRKVWSNAGASGGDRVSVERFARNAWAQLASLHRDLLNGTYRPGPLREVDIPKPAGRGFRRLAIPCVVDRVAQTAAAQVLMPILDAEFEPSSFGYRHGRSVDQAVAQVSLARRDGFNWVLDADIRSYFDNIPHDQLMERWQQSVEPGPLTELILTWLTHARPNGRGVAQGSPLSPVLANLYLDRLDEEFYGRGMRIVRFADDFVILCRSKGGAEAALGKAQRILGEAGLELNAEKTRVIDFEDGFRFLGHLFIRSLAMKTTPERADTEVVTDLLRDVARADRAAEADELSAAATDAENEARGYSAGIRSLHILTRDRRLGLRNKAFVVEEMPVGTATAWRELIAIPYRHIDRIELGPNVTATDEALRHALGTDTMVAYVNGHGETLGWLSDSLVPRAERHLSQARTALDPDARLSLARRLVEARLRNQRAVLRRLLGARAEKPSVVVDTLVKLNLLIGRDGKGVVQHATSIPEVMGYEGEATALWWRSISALAHPDFRFSVRERARGTDPANICLNYLAGQLRRDITVAVHRAGLHPGFGVLHSVSDQRDACVYDLMEEFRAHMIGGLFVYATNRRLVRAEMFTAPTTGTRVSSAGGAALIRSYQARANGKVKSPQSGKRITWQRLMVEQAFSMAKHFEGVCDYRPYIMDY